MIFQNYGHLLEKITLSKINCFQYKANINGASQSGKSPAERHMKIVGIAWFIFL